MSVWKCADCGETALSERSLNEHDCNTVKKTEYAPKDARKDNKPRPSLIPMDILIEYLLPAYEEGLIKYEKESWRRGFKISELMDAVDRHKTAFFCDCEDYDQEAQDRYGILKHHLAGAIFSLISALHTMKYHPELDDRRMGNSGDKLIGDKLIGDNDGS